MEWEDNEQLLHVSEEHWHYQTQRVNELMVDMAKRLASYENRIKHPCLHLWQKHHSNPKHNQDCVVIVCRCGPACSLASKEDLHSTIDGPNEVRLDRKPLEAIRHYIFFGQCPRCKVIHWARGRRFKE